MSTLKCFFSVSVLLVALAVPALAQTFYVAPSGGEDTTNLQNALDYCMNNHLTACTIQLSAGTYHTRQLFGEEFYGSLKGMGMGRTVIQLLGPLDVTSGPVGPGYFGGNLPSRGNKYPYLIIFMAGDITVFDMTFRVIDHDPVKPWYAPEAGYVTNLEGFVGVFGTSANLLVERVGFEGAPGSTWTGRNYEEGPFFFGLSADQPLTGTLKVVSCRIRDAEVSWEIWGLRNAQVTIGGSPSDGNVVENAALGGEFIDLDHSVLEYSHNNIAVDPWDGIGLWQGYVFVPLHGPSQYLIQHNTFKATVNGGNGIWAVDFGPPSGLGKTADFVISDNTIEMNGTAENPAWAGIEAAFTVDAVISNNRISGGNAWFGIAVESGTGCMLKANDLNKLQPLFAPVGLLGDTTWCTVVGGGNNKTNVYDEGSNNVYTGVNNMYGNPPGPAVKAAMQRMHHMLKSRLAH